MADYTRAQNPQYGKIRDPRLDEGDIVFRAVTSGPLPSSPASSSPPPPADAGTAIRPPRQTDPPAAPTATPPAPKEIRTVTAESIVNRSVAADLARQRMPQGALEQRSQCTVINLAGTDRYRCTIWYAVSGALP